MCYADPVRREATARGSDSGGVRRNEKMKIGKGAAPAQPAIVPFQKIYAPEPAEERREKMIVSI